MRRISQGRVGHPGGTAQYGQDRPGVNMAENVAVRGKLPVLFISLEMTGVELADRMLCRWPGSIFTRCGAAI